MDFICLIKVLNSEQNFLNVLKLKYFSTVFTHFMIPFSKSWIDLDPRVFLHQLTSYPCLLGKRPI